MRPAFVAGLLFLCSCQPRTEIMLGVATDIRVPGIDEVDMLVLSHPSGVALLQQYWPIGQSELGASVNLPGSFGVYAPDGNPSSIEVQVAAVKNGQKLVERDAIMTLIAERTLFVRLGLVAGCMNTTGCPAGQTCVEGTCQAETIDVSRLPDFTDDLVNTLTCRSGPMYINTIDNSPMALSPMASQCSTGCQEGVCLKAPSAPMGSAGPPSIDNVSIPTSATAGQTVTAQIVFQASVAVTAVRVAFPQLSQSTLDTLPSAVATGTPIDVNISLPANAPAGPFKVDLSLVDANGNESAVVESVVNVVAG